MNEIKRNIGGKIYRMTNVGNNQKYDRAVEDAGLDATDEQVLAHYDKLGGNIQDQQNCLVSNGQFWAKEKENMIVRKHKKEVTDQIWQITAHPIVSAVIIMLLLIIVLVVFGIDLSRFI